MNFPPVKSHVLLSETGRSGESIYVKLAFASGDIASQLCWDSSCEMVGNLTIQPNLTGDYILNISLYDEESEYLLRLEFPSKFLFDDQAFFGSVSNSTDGVQFFADQEGGYTLYVFQDGASFTDALYNHLLSYNDWAIKNGHPPIDRDQRTFDSICQAFPDTVCN